MLGCREEVVKEVAVVDREGWGRHRGARGGLIGPIIQTPPLPPSRGGSAAQADSCGRCWKGREGTPPFERIQVRIRNIHM